MTEPGRLNSKLGIEKRLDPHILNAVGGIPRDEPTTARLAKAD